MNIPAYFTTGDELGGVRILGVEITSERTYERMYSVRHLCCDREDMLSHDRIQQRIRRGVKACFICSRRNKKCAKPIQIQTEPVALIETPPVIPSATAVLALWYRANARVAARTEARG